MAKTTDRPLKNQVAVQTAIQDPRTTNLGSVGLAFKEALNK